MSSGIQFFEGDEMAVNRCIFNCKKMTVSMVLFSLFYIGTVWFVVRHVDLDSCRDPVTFITVYSGLMAFVYTHAVFVLKIIP